MPRRLLGAGCSQQCGAVPITVAVNGDGCCPSGATATLDSDCGKCGDRIVGPGETCDPPSECPTAARCGTDKPCFTGTFTGNPDTCTSRCELHVIAECRSEDGCCPAACTSEDDSDCSASCGNGTVELGAGETCEPALRSDPCPTDCDDGNPCTRDLMTGSSDNCNSRCTNVPITEPANGDLCCPKGANAVNDGDCAPQCGNGVPELGEECDGGDQCTADCRVIPPELTQCMEIETTASALCQACTCLHCANAMLGCYRSGEQERDQLCSMVVECSNRTGCVQNACFCGDNPDCIAPNGPCRMEISTAAKTVYRNQVGICSMNQSCPVYWSRLIGECRAAQCAAECASTPDAGAPTAQ